MLEIGVNLPFRSFSTTWTKTLARLPEVGKSVPRSGGPIARLVGRMVLRAMGWRIDGRIPDLRKMVIIAAPHTTNWDFIVGIAAKLALELRVLWLGKHSLFRFPLGTVLRALGGLPVDRSTSHNVVESIVREFDSRERLILGLAPEGTRKRVPRWRTGFYHIARAAKVPIVTVALNWEARALQIGPPFATTGDVDADLRELQRRLDVPGHRPKR
jgi:1-acyl-sn-glycerol-3-phosphate acyltransferase